jgi:hypothetical protein
MWTAAPQPGTELLPIQQQSYPEEEQARVHTRQIDTKLWAAQHHDELAGDQEALDAQLTKLHRHKAALGTERAATIDFTKAQARARAITTTINHEGTSRPTFARALLGRGRQGVPSVEGHPQCSHGAAGGKLAPVMGQGFRHEPRTF